MFIGIIFFNLEKLDISGTPIKSNLLVCLGGGTGERLQKTIELYKNGFVENNIIISDTKEKDILIKYNKIKEIVNKENFVITKSFTKNTLDELLFSQEILRKYNYKSILIISDEPHSRRIKILIDNFTEFNNLDIKYTIVGSNISWWNKNKFYENKKAILFSISEFFKILHNYTIYSLKKYNLIDERNIESINYYKNEFTKSTNRIIKNVYNFIQNII